MIFYINQITMVERPPVDRSNTTAQASAVTQQGAESRAIQAVVVKELNQAAAESSCCG